MTPPTRSRDDPPGRRKAVLFCPACGYEGEVPAGWLEETTDAARLLVCPDCGAVVDRRSRGHPVVAEA